MSIADDVRAAKAAQEGPALAKLGAICRLLPGMFKRLPTRLPILDEITRGGLQTRRLAILAGAPGGYKTTLALAIGYDMARAGVDTPSGHMPIVVGIIAADESRIGLMSRIGQRHGVSRDALEDEDTAVSRPAWEHIGDTLDALPTFSITDPTEPTEPRSVEETITLLVALAASLGARLLLIVDSLQKARCDTDAVNPDSSVREKIDRRLEMLRDSAQRHDMCIVATCELARSGYREGNRPTMADMKESGGIEYTADLVLGMHRPSKDEPFVVEVEALKNRISSEHDGVRFRLRRTTQCAFESVEMPDESDEGRSAAQEAAAEARIASMAVELERALVTAASAPTNRADLQNLIGGTQALRVRAASLLINSGRIEGGNGKPYRRVAIREVA